MESLYRLKDTVLDFLASPAAKRRRTVGPSTPSNKQLSEQLSTHLPASDPQDSKAQAALQYRIIKTESSASDSRFGPGSRKRAREEDEMEDQSMVVMEIESIDTSVGGDFGRSGSWGGEEVSPHESASQITPVGESVDGSGNEEEDDAEIAIEDDEVSGDDKVKAYLAKQESIKERKGRIEMVRASGDWLEEEIYLFERLEMLGLEPIVPISWSEFDQDAKIWPEDIFAPYEVHGKDLVISHNHLDCHSGLKPLVHLTQVGRNCIGTTPEVCERRLELKINYYKKWCDRDGGYDKKRYIPNLLVIKAKPGQTTVTLMKHLESQFNYLAKQHRQSLLLDTPITDEFGELQYYRRRPPLLYSLLNINANVIVNTWDSANPAAEVRNIAAFDFKDGGQSLWNGFRVAIVMNAAKNALMPHVHEYEDESESDDPDL